MAKNKTKKKRDLESLQRKRRTAMRDLNTGTEEEKLKKAEIRREQVKISKYTVQKSYKVPKTLFNISYKRHIAVISTFAYHKFFKVLQLFLDSESEKRFKLVRLHSQYNWCLYEINPFYAC